MSKKQFTSLVLGIFCFSYLCLAVYANNTKSGDNLKRHGSNTTCAECHTNESNCSKCHMLHLNKYYTQDDLNAQIAIAVEQAESAIISKYDPNKDGQIGLEEVIYYLQVIADKQQ